MLLLRTKAQQPGGVCRAVIPGAGGGTGVSEDMLMRGSGLACHCHGAGVPQSTWSGYPGGKKDDLAPILFTFKVSTAVQMEELLIPGLRSSTSDPAARPVPVQGLHIGKTCANKPLKLLVQDPWDFPKHREATDTIKLLFDP